MKLAVANTLHPFVRGGAEMHAEALVRELRERGHSARLVRVPHAWNDVDAILRGMMASSLVRVPGADRIVALKFPTYYIRHDDKVVWMLHQLRQVYDLWQGPEGYGSLPAHYDLRRRVRNLDVRTLRDCRRYAISEVSRNRLRRFNDLDAEVLHQPLPDSQGFYCEEYGDFVFCPSRIGKLKRQELLVRALALTRTPVRLHLAGAPDGPIEMVEALWGIARASGVENRLTLDSTFISEELKQRLYARALATAYVPFDEDSYGYVTLESAASQKAIITCRDSGGVLTVVRDGESGLVADSTPAAIAACMDRLYEDRLLARRLGEGAAAAVAAMDISWDRVVRVLTA